MTFLLFCRTSRRRHTISALVTGVQTCALPIFARRAALFPPPPRVWSVEGRSLVPTAPAAVPVPASSLPAPDLAELLVDADLEVVVEGGIVRGEVNGLEVARIVHGHTTVCEPIEEPLLEVAVAQPDLALTGMLTGPLTTIAQHGRDQQNGRP